MMCVRDVVCHVSLTDDVPATTTDVDIQLLEAAKAGDVEVVKVTV